MMSLDEQVAAMVRMYHVSPDVARSQLTRAMHAAQPVVIAPPPRPMAPLGCTKAARAERSRLEHRIAARDAASIAPIILRVPLPGNRGNERLHWSQKHSAAEDFYAQAAALRNPPPPYAPLLCVSLHFHVDHGAASPGLDWDNCMARMKYPLDYLVHAQYLRNDSPIEIPTPPALSQTCSVKPKGRGITITLTPIERPT